MWYSGKIAKSRKYRLSVRERSKLSNISYKASTFAKAGNYLSIGEQSSLENGNEWEL